MQKHEKRIAPAVAAMLMMSIGLSVTACNEVDSEEVDALRAEEPEPPKEMPGKSVPVDELPFVDAIDSAETFVQRLPEPIPSGEDVAVHMKLPATHNPELSDSLIRVVGGSKDPLVLFRSDALVEIGLLEDSPGKSFFTAFVKFDKEELIVRDKAESVFGQAEKASETLLVFEGRTPVAITTGIAFDFEKFAGGVPVALGSCPVRPLSELARWEESLMITDLDVVQDSERTHDVCAGGGNPDGVWTFKHLMEEMATGSGMSTHDFVVAWLENWLNDYAVNNDVVPARLDMFNKVIEPWANASGVTATLSVGSPNSLSLSGPLDLDQAPFRLSAIVNRIDLGGTATSPGGYGGGTVSTPTDAGELRFVFGVQNLDTCNVMRFSVIFEYGVPITGCGDVRDWARDWTDLNDPGFAGRFDPTWRDHLESLTESVVVHGAAPSKGNQSAINQVRTNENALDPGFQWEFREFTLSIEDPVADTNTPANGPLRPHTVAMTPDDGPFHPSPNATIDAFVLSDVLAGVPASVPTLPDDCRASYTVPGQFLGEPFRGANSLTAGGAGPTHWNANVNPSDNREACARHQFSFNTCNGCHFSDTSTPFFHVDPQASPAGLSDFLTGGTSGIWTVPDPQFGAPDWEFRDLDLRFKRLYKIACAPCGGSLGLKPSFLEVIAEIAGAVPIDPIEKIEFPLPIGPVKDLGAVKDILELRSEFVNPDKVRDVELGNFVRKHEPKVH